MNKQAQAYLRYIIYALAGGTYKLVNQHRCHMLSFPILGMLLPFHEE